MRGRFFYVIFYLSTLFLVIACKPVSEFIDPVNYIETVKKIEINSPDYNNNKMINLENLVYSFLKTNYDDVTKENITWEEEGKLENGALIKASYKDAFVEIRAIKNGDFIEVKPIEIDFRDKNSNRYNILNVPFKNVTNEANVSNNTSTNTSYNDLVPNNNTNSSNEDYSSNYNNNSSEEEPYSKYKNKFGKVVNDKYVGGDFIEFVKNADYEESFYLKEQFWEMADNMYVTKDKKTYYYLFDIINKLEEKADTNMPRIDFLEVEGKKLYYTVGFPKDYNANTPSWIQFEIFERKFQDGLALRTAHVSCAINGIEYKDWEAIDAIYK